MTDGLRHVLLTRFNLPSRGYESVVRTRENWLRDRVVLFERYCLPSVRAQTQQTFSWIIYFGLRSPAWLLDWMRGHEQRGHFRAFLREEVPRADLLGDITSVVGTGDELLTTNLDNDDSLATDFVARVRSVPVDGERTAVYLADGLIGCGGRLYRRTDRHNAFCSVREPWDRPVTCWADWHNALPGRMPSVVLRGNPGWLQVVHGTNVSNRVRGRRTRPSAHRDAFPGLLDDLPDPTVREVAADYMVAAPGRALREAGRVTAKAALNGIAGRQALDRAKVVWASARRPLR